MFKSIAKYCKESYDELVHKVTWPTSKELAGTAVLVLSASIIIALVVFGINSLFGGVMTRIYELIS